MAIIEKRLDSIDDTLGHLLQVNEVLANAVLELKQLNVHTQTQIGQINQRLDQTDRRIDLMQQELESMNRFNLQTRRLWIVMARKHNMLDDDDINAWETEDL